MALETFDEVPEYDVTPPQSSTVEHVRDREATITLPEHHARVEAVLLQYEALRDSEEEKWVAGVEEEMHTVQSRNRELENEIALMNKTNVALSEAVETLKSQCEQLTATVRDLHRSQQGNTDVLTKRHEHEMTILRNEEHKQRLSLASMLGELDLVKAAATAREQELTKECATMKATISA